MRRLLSVLLLSAVFGVSNVSLAVDTPQLGVRTDTIGTINGWTVWTGWNGSFSDSYAPESETYNWVVYFAPEAIYVGLLSAESVYSAVDVFASVGTFFGAYKSPDGDVSKWSDVSNLYGVTISKDLTLAAVPVGPMSGGSISAAAGFTLFRVGDTPIFRRALQLNVSYGASFALVSIPLAPTVTMDFKSNITGQDTGFWPVILWDMEVDPDLDPVTNVILQLQKVLAEKTNSPDYAMVEPMARRILTVAGQMSPTGLGGGGATATGAYLGNLFAEPEPSTPGSPKDLRDKASEWISSEDTSAPAKIIGSLPIPLPKVVEDLRPVKQAVEVTFEVAYRNGYERAVQDGKRDADTIYADCLVTDYCKSGEECTISVKASDIAALIPGTSANDFEGASVWFDSTPESWLNSGQAGGEIQVAISGGVAEFDVTQGASYPLLVGAKLYKDTSNNKTGGKHVELCAHQIIFYQDIEPEQVEATGGEVTSLSVTSPADLDNPGAMPDDMYMGLVGFEATVPPGGKIEVGIPLPQAIPESHSWYKFLGDGKWVDLLGEDAALKGDGAKLSADRTTVTLVVTDNGPLDLDPKMGSIKDPSGPGFSADVDPGSFTPTDGTPGSNGSGGGCQVTEAATPTSPLPILLLMLSLLALAAIRRSRV